MVGCLFDELDIPSVRSAPRDHAPPLRREQLIERIVVINPSASSTFLSSFPEDRLEEYLARLSQSREPRGGGSRWVRQATTPAIVWRESPED